MSTLSLYRACILKVASALKNGYWNNIGSSIVNNPFSDLPVRIVEELISTILHLSSPGSLKVIDLYHLLTSGRVNHFKLEDILLNTEDLVSILMSLSVASQRLLSLVFKNVNCTDPFTKNEKIFKEGKALECLLRVSPLLESLDTCIPFDLKVLKNCTNLNSLKINFIRTKPLYRFLEDNKGHYCHNTSLKYMDIYEDFRNPVPFLDFVPIIKYCTQLTYFNADISRSLEFLHSEEVEDGSLSTTYKFQKCYLGSSFIDDGAATPNAVHIATLTCPEMKEVDILVNNNESIYALSDFKQLDSLLMQWENPVGANFQLGVQPMLNKAGATLKSLHILNFSNVDFAAIATMCPLLEVLKVEYQNEFRGYECPAAGLANLKNLHIELVEFDYGCCEDTLIMFLSNCPNLSVLYIDGARNLHDGILNQILSRNNLVNLKEAVVFDCSLSEAGIRNLVSHLSSLQFFQFSSSQIAFEAAADIVHEINPHVILVADDNF